MGTTREVEDNHQNNRFAKRLQSFKGFEHLLKRFDVNKPAAGNPALHPSEQKHGGYSCAELQQFIRFFPSHFTIGLPGSSFRYRHIQDEVILSLHSLPSKYRIPQYNLLGFLLANQGNYNYAFRYFHEVSSLQENNIISIANQAHCYLRQNLPEKAHDCLRRLISLTSSADFLQITKESLYMSDAKSDLGYAYHVFGLNNAAKRMYESALLYNGDNINANFGLAATLLSISFHENRSRKDFHLKVAHDLISVVLTNEAAFLPATIMLLRVKAERKALTINQLDSYITAILQDHNELIDAKMYRDLACVKMARMDYEKELGAIRLLERSIELTPTSEAYHLLGKAHYSKWQLDKKKRKTYVKRSLSLAIKEAGMELSELSEVTEEVDQGSNTNLTEPPAAILLKTKSQVTETDMLKTVKQYYEDAAKKCYNSNLETLLELGIICGKLAEHGRATDLLRRAVTSEDTSLQERGYRYLAIFEMRNPLLAEAYLREATSRQLFVKLSEGEREEFCERVYSHAEEVLLEKGHNHAHEWIRVLVEAGFHRADFLVEQYNKDSCTPMKGLNGEVPNGTKKLNSRKHSKSKMM